MVGTISTRNKVQRARPERHGHLEQVLRHRAIGVEDLEGEGRQRRDHHDEQDAELDAVEPDDGDHHPGQRRDALEEHQHRGEIAFDERRAADDHGQNTAEQECAEQARRRSARR